MPKSYFDNVSKQNNNSSYTPNNFNSVGSYFDKKPFEADPNYYTNKTINDSAKTLSDNGLGTPIPDSLNTPKRAWYEKFIFDPISSLSYGLARGTKNLADDNKDTGFVQGAIEGVKSGFNGDRADQRTSWKEVLDTLLSSQNSTKRNTTAFVNNLVNPFAWQDITDGKDMVQTAKDHTGLTGFAGDVLLDPMNLLGGLGGASKLLSKGSKGIEAVKDLEKFGDLGKATEVLSRIQDTVKPEQAKYLVDKTAKFMGKMPDYKGITLGTEKFNKVIVKPETIAKLGNTIPFKIINSALDIVKESDMSKGVSKLFGGGQYGDILRSAKANPETAMENLAYVDVLKRLKNINVGHNLNVEANVEDFLKGIGNSNDEIVKKAEQGDIYKQVPNGTVDIQQPNSEFNPAFHQDLLNRQNKLEQLKGMLKDVNTQLEHALPSERAGLLNQLDELTNEINNQRVASEQIASNVDSIKPLEKPLEVPITQESTLGLNDIVKPTVEPVGSNKPILEQIHELDAQLGRKPTKFIDGTTEEQMAKTLERRKADLNIPEPSKVEKPKPTIEETLKKLDENMKPTIKPDLYNQLEKAHEELKLPFGDKEKAKYKYMTDKEALNELKFLNAKDIKRARLTTDTYDNSLEELYKATKEKPSFDIHGDFNEANDGLKLVERARLLRKVVEKDKTPLTKLLTYNNVSLQEATSLANQLREAFPEAKWLEHVDETEKEVKSVKSIMDKIKGINNPENSKYHVYSTKEVTKNMVKVNKDVVKDSLVRDLMFLEHGDKEVIKDALASARNKPDEFKILDKDKKDFLGASAKYKDKTVPELKSIIEKQRSHLLNGLLPLDLPDLKKMSKQDMYKEIDLNNREMYSVNKNKSVGLGENKTAKLENRDSWVSEQEAKRLELDKTKSEIESATKTKITKDDFIDNSKNIPDDIKESFKIDKHLDPITEQQANNIAKIVGNLKENNPIAYQDIKKALGGSFRKDMNQLKVDMFYNELKKYSKPDFVKAKVEQAVEDVKQAVKENKVIELNPVQKQTETKNLINTIAEVPKEKLIAVTNNPTVSQKISEIKDTVKAFDLKAQDLTNSKASLERRIKILETEIQSPEVRLKAFKREFKDKYPEYITAQEQVFKNEKVKGAYDDLPVGAKATAERITEEFKRMGIEEGIITKEQSEGLYNYVAHIMNFDHRNNQEYIDLFNKEIKNPNNKHAKERGLEGTIAEINKFMEEKHGVKDFFETNIVKIYAERAMAHNKYMFDKDIVQKTVDLYGKKFDFTALKSLEDDSYKEALTNWRELLDSGKYSVVRLEDKYSPVDVLSLKGKSKEEAQNLFRNHMPFSEVSLQDIEKRTLMEYKDQPLYLVPKEAHKNYLKIAEGQYKHESNGLLKTFDKFMGLWKASALFSSSFHINNMIGNTFNSYLSIGNDILNPKLNGYALRIINPLGKDTEVVMGKTIKEWKETLHNYGVLDRDMISNEFKDFRQNKIENLNPNPFKKFNPYKISKDVGEKIEHQARVVNFLSHMKNGKTEQEASDLVNKFLFDYSDLTDFEQNTMKRIVPFYTWLRKNIPLQLEQVFNNPAKYGKIYRGTKEVSKKETEEQKRLRPDYLKNAIYRGDNKYLSMNLPYNDLGKATDVKELAGGLNPLLKLAIELGTNKNLYFDSPIAQREGDMVQAPTYLNGIAKDTPNGKMIDAKLRYALRNLLPSVEQVSNGYDVLSGNKGDESKFNAFTKGGKVTEVDFKKLKEQALRDYATKMTNTVANNKEQGYIKKNNVSTKKKASYFDK